MLDFLVDVFELNPKHVSLKHTAGPFVNDPAWLDDYQLRFTIPNSIHPVFCIYGAYLASLDKKHEFPEANTYPPFNVVVSQVQEFFADKKDLLYPIGQVPFSAVLTRLISRLKSVEQYCLASISTDFSFRGRAHDTRQDDLCRIDLVLKDEVQRTGRYDFHITLVLAGPKKIEHVLEMAAAKARS